jgi:hypothetical protein
MQKKNGIVCSSKNIPCKNETDYRLGRQIQNQTFPLSINIEMTRFLLSNELFTYISGT